MRILATKSSANILNYILKSCESPRNGSSQMVHTFLRLLETHLSNLLLKTSNVLVSLKHTYIQTPLDFTLESHKDLFGEMSETGSQMIPGTCIIPVTYIPYYLG